MNKRRASNAALDMLAPGLREGNERAPVGHYEVRYDNEWEFISAKDVYADIRRDFHTPHQIMERLRAGEIIQAPFADYRYVREDVPNEPE